MKQSDYKERSNRKALALFFILFFLIVAATCHAQNRAYPTPMKYSCGKLDTIYISIAHDSISDTHHLTVSCTKHNHTEWKSITFGFVDGDMLEVYQDFGWEISNPKLLEKVEFDYVSFDETYFSTACINIRTKDYFIKYFNK